MVRATVWSRDYRDTILKSHTVSPALHVLNAPYGPPIWVQPGRHDGRSASNQSCADQAQTDQDHQGSRCLEAAHPFVQQADQKGGKGGRNITDALGHARQVRRHMTVWRAQKHHRKGKREQSALRQSLNDRPNPDARQGCPDEAGESSRRPD